MLADLSFLTSNKGSNRAKPDRALSGAPASLRLIVETGTPQASAQMQNEMGDLQPKVRLAVPVDGFSSTIGMEVFVGPADFSLAFARDQIALMPEEARITQPDGLVRLDEGISPVMYFMFMPDGAARTGMRTGILCNEAITGGASGPQRPAVCIHRFLRPLAARASGSR